MVWFQMRQLSTKDQITQKLANISHHTDFNNSLNYFLLTESYDSLMDFKHCLSQWISRSQTGN